MPPSAKRRRSTRDVDKEMREEEDLVASLFGGKKSRRDVQTDMLDESEDGSDEEAGPSNYRQNPEQYLDDDKVSTLMQYEKI
jgi:hypothetical protein